MGIGGEQGLEQALSTTERAEGILAPALRRARASRPGRRGCAPALPDNPRCRAGPRPGSPRARRPAGAGGRPGLASRSLQRSWRRGRWPRPARHGARGRRHAGRGIPRRNRCASRSRSLRSGSSPGWLSRRSSLRRVKNWSTASRVWTEDASARSRSRRARTSPIVVPAMLATIVRSRTIPAAIASLDAAAPNFAARR